MTVRKFACEKHVKKAIKEILNEYGAWHFMPNMSGLGRAGIPDVIACIRGTFLAIEAKFGGNHPTKPQEDEIHAINLAGGHAVVVDEKNLDDFRQLVQALAGVK